MISWEVRTGKREVRTVKRERETQAGKKKAKQKSIH